MSNYRVKITVQLKTSIDVDDADSEKEAAERAKRFVSDALAIEAYAIDHIKVSAKTKVTRLPDNKEVKKKHGKTKKSKS